MCLYDPWLNVSTCHSEREGDTIYRSVQAGVLSIYTVCFRGSYRSRMQLTEGLGEKGTITNPSAASGPQTAPWIYRYAAQLEYRYITATVRVLLSLAQTSVRKKKDQWVGQMRLAHSKYHPLCLSAGGDILGFWHYPFCNLCTELLWHTVR